MLNLTEFFQGKVLAGVSGREMDFVIPSEAGRTLNPEQLQYLTEAFSCPFRAVFTARQVHGNDVLVATRDALESRPPFPEGDSIVTREKGLPIAVRTADCLPVFLYDPVHEAIGIIHAGWRGTQAGIAGEALAKMTEEWQTRPEDVRAAFGPAIGSCCYEVGEEFREYFPKETSVREGQVFLDLPAVNQRLLIEAGVRLKNIKPCGICTCCSKDCFSYRREKNRSGRHLSLMVICD